MHEVQMPKFGATMSQGEISEWYVKVGDKVAKGDSLCEVASEKITNVLECFVDGTVEQILLEEGDSAEIGTVIALIKVT